MEYIDILDEQGNKTGEVKSKLEVHQIGLWHKTAHIWFINSQKEILLQLRSKDKKNFPNMWDISVAGHISSGEDSIVGALREIKEEIGIDVLASDLHFLSTLKDSFILNNGTHLDNEFNDVYIVISDIELSSLEIQQEEVDDIKYISIEELKTWVKEKRDNLVLHIEEYKLLFDYIDNNFIKS